MFLARHLRSILAATGVFLLVGVGMPVTASGDDDDVREGIAAYEAGDLQAAMDLLSPYALDGDPEAQYYVGAIYYRDGAEDAAARWFRRAAEANEPRAQHNLGLIHLDGVGVPQDYAEARRWFERAAEQGHAGSMTNLAFLHDRGIGVSRDPLMAVKWYLRAADAGVANAQFRLGQLYEIGRGVDHDYDRAAHWYGRASEKGHATAQVNLANLMMYGLGVDADPGAAILLWESAANAGHTEAMLNLALVYSTGAGETEDHERAFYWIVRAARALEGTPDHEVLELKETLSEGLDAETREALVAEAEDDQDVIRTLAPADPIDQALD